jgi:hypothetical protein
LAREFFKSLGKSIDRISFAYLFLNAEDPLVELAEDEWARIRGEVLDTLAVQLSLLKNGDFPIIPGRHCGNCDAASLCRRTDSISAYRSEEGPAEKLWALREKGKP